jgi:hypothetical protein
MVYFFFIAPLLTAGTRDNGECSTRAWQNNPPEYFMRAILIPGAFAVAAAAMSLSPEAASAKGCIKGAIVAGIAGHYAGHHGLLGAGAGCAIGHHEANKHAREGTEHDRAYDSRHCDGYGTGAPSDDRGYDSR